MFGCYRRGDANDADTYVTAIASVLAHYSAEVVKAVTDPYSGLPSRKKENGYSGMPDVADVKEACEAEAVRQDRMAEYAKRPVNLKRLPRPPAGIGAFANVLITTESPQYARMVKHIEGADSREWKWDETSRGLWVSLSWIDAPVKRTEFKKPKVDIPEPQAAPELAPNDPRDEWVMADSENLSEV